MRLLGMLLLVCLCLCTGYSLGILHKAESQCVTPILSEVTADKWLEKIQDTLGNVHYDTTSRYIVIRSVDGHGSEADIYSVLMPDNTAYDGLSLHDVKTVLQGKELN